MTWCSEVHGRGVQSLNHSCDMAGPTSTLEVLAVSANPLPVRDLLGQGPLLDLGDMVQVSTEIQLSSRIGRHLEPCARFPGPDDGGRSDDGVGAALLQCGLDHPQVTCSSVTPLALVCHGGQTS